MRLIYSIKGDCSKINGAFLNLTKYSRIALGGFKLSGSCSLNHSMLNSSAFYKNGKLIIEGENPDLIENILKKEFNKKSLMLKLQGVE